MVLVDNDTFLTPLAKMYGRTRQSGSVWLTMKKCECVVLAGGLARCCFVCVGSRADLPHAVGGVGQKKKEKGKGSSKERKSDEERCLVRATDGKVNISTVVRAGVSR